MIEILIVDDQNLVLTGIKTMLDSIEDINVKGAETSGKNAMEFLQYQQVDVIVTDISMPEMDGLETIRAIKKTYPDIRVIALTVFRDPELIKRAISLGFSGFLLKSSRLEDLIEAIRKVSQGQEYFSTEVTKLLIESFKPKSDETYSKFKDFQPYVRSKSHPKLSSREMEILKELVTGKSAKKIAKELSISLHTVHSHRKNILSKLKLSDTAGLVKYAIQNNIINF